MKVKIITKEHALIKALLRIALKYDNVMDGEIEADDSDTIDKAQKYLGSKLRCG